MKTQYEAVIGLEVHAQLGTNTKIFSRSAVTFGEPANSVVNEVCAGYPGALPVLQREAVTLALRAGVAFGCNIRRKSQFARKNYFYPDLPKGYQISQFDAPLCEGGELIFEVAGESKRCGITRIHMEEDAGKSIHDVDPFNTLVDLNRAGVPLVEIVSEPDIRSGQEAYDYLVEIRRLVRYLDICDGNMEEGSLRCDANISLRPKGVEAFGTRCEVKNMNSFRNVMRAIEFEAQRQSEILDAGGVIHMETRTFDAGKGTTVGMRSKELAHDYRYFPEPDLQPITVSEASKEAIRRAMPPLPRELREKYTKELGLSDYDAGILTEDKATALYYEAVIALTPNFKGAANWVMGDVRSWMNERGLTMEQFPIRAERLAGLVHLIDAGQVSHTIASQKLFPLMLEDLSATAEQLALKHDLVQSTNEDEIIAIVRQAMATYPEKVEAYRSGNKGLLGLFMGEVMKGTKGKADPKRANEVVRRTLEN